MVFMYIALNTQAGRVLKLVPNGGEQAQVGF